MATTPQEIKQKAANLSTEERAAVNTQLSGMSQEDLSKRSQAPQEPVSPTGVVNDSPQPGVLGEKIAFEQVAATDPRTGEKVEVGRDTMAIVDKTQQRFGESDRRFIDRRREDIMSGDGGFEEKRNKFRQFRGDFQGTEQQQPKTEPVQQVQEVKNQALINEADEIAVQEQKKTQVTNDFNAKLQSGASTEELAKYAASNPDYSDSFRDSIRAQFKTQGNMKFFNEYNGMNNDSMYSAVQSGAIKVGSERYNMLPEAQRQSFEQFKQAKDAPAGVPQTKEEAFSTTSPENTVDFSNIESFISKMFSSDLRGKLDAARNDDRVVELSTDLNNKASELEKFDLEGIRASKKLRKELGNSGLTPAAIRSAVIDDEANRAIIRMGKVSEYNRVQGNLQSIKDDIDNDLELFKFEDQQAKEKYSMLFSVYESRRGEQRARTDKLEDREYTEKVKQEEREFLQQNQEIATQRQQDFQREMKKIDQDFALKSEKPTYQIARDGKMYAIVDGKAQEVMTLGGELLFGEEDDKFSSDIRYNDDGTITEVKVYKDGRSPFISTYDVQGNKVSGAPDALQSFIEQCRVTGQCGAGANDYAQQLGMGRIFGDSYESKMKNVDSQDPQIGGFAVWNPSQGQGKYSEYGHVGIVTGYNKETGKVTINDWNYDGDEKQKTHEVNLSEITFNGGFVSPNTDKFTPQVSINQADVPLYKKYLNGKLTAADQKTIGDIDSFKSEAVKYQEDLTAQGTPQIEKLIALATSLRDDAPGRKGRIAADTGIGRTVSSDLADYQANYDAFISNNALDQLVTLKSNGATFGALSDKELQFIQSSATNLRANLSDDGFKSELNRIIDALSLGLSDDVVSEIQEPVSSNAPMTPVTSVKDYYKIKGKYNTTGLPQ